MQQLLPDLKSRLVEVMYPVFGQEPSFFSDSPTVVEILRSIGLNAFLFNSADNISTKHKKNAVVIGTNNDTIPQYRQWHTWFRSSRVLMIPVVSFDPSIEATIYTLELLAHTRFEDAVKLNEAWVKILMEREEPMQLVGNNCELDCTLGDDICVMKPRTTCHLLPGEWDSIGTFFEVPMTPHPEEIRPPFAINGTITVPGVAVAHHRQMHENLLPLVDQAWNLFKYLREQNMFPIHMQIKDSKVIKAIAGEKDILEELNALTNKRREMVLTEMSFSTNSSVALENIDWTKNSQMNEGLLGIHLALGDGLTGAHIDFICPGVELKN